MKVRIKIAINNHIYKQVNSFNGLGYTVTLTNSKDLETKMNRFNQVSCTIRRALTDKTRKDTQIQLYKAITVPVPVPTRGSEIWSMTKK
jgi:hypothetical protein